jgi:hypothetical protein
LRAQGDAQGGDVRHHVGRVGQQRQRSQGEAGDDLDDQQRAVRNEACAQGSFLSFSKVVWVIHAATAGG